MTSGKPPHLRGVRFIASGRKLTLELGSDWFGFSVGTIAQTVWMRFGIADDGRVACTGLVLGLEEEEAVTARLLRKIKPGELVDFAAGAIETGASGHPEHQPTFDAAIAAIGRPLRRARARRGRKRLSQSDLEDIAELYRTYVRRFPRNPVKQLAKALYLSEPTLRRWLARARDVELLGPAPDGRAGEVSPRLRRKAKGARRDG